MRLLLPLLFAGLVSGAPPLLQQDFTANDGGWIGFIGKMKIRVVHDAAELQGEKSAIALEYEASSSTPGIAILPLTRSLAGMKRLRLSLRAEAPTAVAVLLSERQPGGNYSAIVWLQPHTWQHVELAPEDFFAGRTPNDPVDPDGKLDLDHLQAIGIVDISQILAKIGEAETPLVVAAHAGPHRLLLSSLEATTEDPKKGGEPNSPLLLDDFHLPHLAWLTLGGADLQLDTSKKVLAKPCLQATYQQADGHYVVLSRPLEVMDRSGATHIAFDIASEKSAQMALSFEQHVQGKPDGPRYNVDVEVPGGNQSASREIALSAFEKDENSPADPEGKLNLAKVKSVGFVDFSGSNGEEPIFNTVRIANLRLIRKDAAAK